ncbi:MAG TPA: PHB depolymerase family esterase [Burkholderiaceae bacterium]|nr:PHB depolymerase family esterase [Burkholderiaceae bacterium]
MVRIAVACVVLVGIARVPQAASLPPSLIDRAQVTVSGLSSGGYMATQLHVAWSSLFRGAGVVAAGPYYCAQGLATFATTRCLTRDSAPPVSELVATARQWAALGLIDPTSNLRDSKVWLFAGSNDTVLVPALDADLKRFYEVFVQPANVVLRSDVPAEHGMPTDDYGSACAHRGLPFINNCRVDGAGELLRHLLGALAPRNDGALSGRFVEFDQSEFIAADQGMAKAGWLFVPQACTAGSACRLHVALHGCGQNAQSLGDEYVKHTGYNRWADSNRIVVLYPQTSNDALNACWDWWGYTGADYAQKSAPQVGAIVAMVERLAGTPAICSEAMNGWHVWAGRAHWDGLGSAVAKGSGQRLGWWWRTTSLRESPRGHFVEGRC